MHLTPKFFKKYASENLNNPRLRKTYRFATQHALEKRLQAIQDVPEWEDLRDRAHQIKEDAIKQLDSYLETLEKNVIANGGKVFWARDGAEASDYILEVAKGIQTRSIVKSKSMTTEEIGLTPVLEKNGYEVVETDLGEYIIQLANEMPSHITAPALHKSREEVGQLFAEKLGIPYTSVPEDLCEVARKILRSKFLSAELGISGVNFALADTGTIVVVENEGNARLSTTMPRIHIAVMGLEKVIPKFADLPIFLRLLGRSSTGQKQTSYVSLISSPRKFGETDGPEEFHLVILDNGRTEILADPKMRESLFCIRCGACLNTCPIYQRVGGHSYGSVYSGPIGAVISPLYQGISNARDLPFASSLCGSCSNICPVKIDIHHMLLWLRKQLVDTNETPWRERLAMKVFLTGMKDSRIYAFGSWAFRMALKLTGTTHRPLKIPGWTETRDLPPLATKSFKTLWKHMERREEN
jgi:L-lactate dehydrogenase complex protein LldF